MGEYAEKYTLETFNVDISSNPKTKWKWACSICNKNLASKQANINHVRDKHKKYIEKDF